MFKAQLVSCRSAACRKRQKTLIATEAGQCGGGISTKGGKKGLSCRLLNLMSMLSFLYRQIRSEVRALIINRPPYTSQRCVPSGDVIHKEKTNHCL